MALLIYRWGERDKRAACDFYTEPQAGDGRLWPWAVPQAGFVPGPWLLSIVWAGNSPGSFGNVAVTGWRQAKNDAMDITLGIEGENFSVGAGNHK